MGLGIGAIQSTLELWQQGLFENIENVVEMGSQELHLKEKDLEEMLKVAGLENFNKEEFPNIGNWPEQPRCPSSALYKKLGAKDYYCFDVNGEHGALQHDWNLPFEDKSLYNYFDLVTDHGACEHAFNISETYKTIHKLCKPGGLIMIHQSLWGGNGYFLYDKHFFEGIAAANGYKILFSSYVVCPNEKTFHGSEHQFHIPLNSALLKSIDLKNTPEIGVSAILQKQNDEEFKIPYQGQYLAEKQNHYGFNKLYYQDPPSHSYVPAFDLDHVSGKNLLTQLLKRIKGRF